MGPEKTNDKPVFTVQDGDGKTFTLADVFELAETDNEADVKNPMELDMNLLSKERDETVTIEWKVPMKKVAKAVRLIRKRRRLYKKIEEIDHKWLGLFEIAGAKKQETEEDENEGNGSD